MLEECTALCRRQYHHSPLFMSYRGVTGMDKLMSVHLNTSPLGLSPLSIIPTCIMTAGDYLCQRKTRHFKTPAPPPRSVTKSLCTRSRATPPVYSAFHYYMPRRQRSKPPARLCKMMGAKTEFTFRLLMGGPQNHTLL